MRLLSLLCSSHKTSHFSPAKVLKSLANVTAKVLGPAKALQRLRKSTLRWLRSFLLPKRCRWRRAFPLAFISGLKSAWRMITYRKVFPLCKFHRIREARIWGKRSISSIKEFDLQKKRDLLGVKYQELQEIAFILQLYVLHLCRIFNRPFIWKL